MRSLPSISASLELALKFVVFGGVLYWLGIYTPVWSFFGDGAVISCGCYVGFRNGLVKSSFLTLKLLGLTLLVLVAAAGIGVHLLEIPNTVFGRLFYLTLMFYLGFGIGRIDARKPFAANRHADRISFSISVTRRLDGKK